MKKQTSKLPVHHTSDFILVVKYTGLAVIAVTLVTAIAGDADVAIPISFGLLVFGLIAGYWVYKK
jgi:hypothetical protein